MEAIGMKLKVITGILLTLFLIGMLTLAFNIKPVKASGTIYIRADGSIEPLTANITTVDNVTYTLTDNNYDSIVVERDNIVVDGADYTVKGTGAYLSTGIGLTGRSNVTIKNMKIEAFYYGIWLSVSSNNSIYGNNITNNYYGIWLFSSFNNIVCGNNITANNHYGILLYWSSNNVFRSNSMINNKCNFDVWGAIIEGLVNDVDVSNTINGKPIYYWISKRDMAVPLDAGYVALVNCTHITVQNLNLTNGQGVLLAFTTNSTITNNKITNNYYGIWLSDSSNNSISGNNIANNSDGIRLSGSSSNSISKNNIANNGNGIWLGQSSNNGISGNNIRANSFGVVLYESSNNKFYHNNFINNIQQVYIETSGYTNFWDDGYPSGGNYWSNYTDVDQYSGPYQNETGSDGIWDHPYVIDANNRDNYPIVPEFPTWTSILLILIVLTVAIAIYKRRLLKTPIH